MNRALSTGNACLYGLVRAAILSAGYSPALGFIHTGKQLSFVYDIADLYKADIIIPAAFETATWMGGPVEKRMRLVCRERFRESRLMQRIIPDMQDVLGVDESARPPTTPTGISMRPGRGRCGTRTEWRVRGDSRQEA